MVYSVSMSFAERLREIMKARGVEQTALAAHLGIRSQSVNQWGKGRTQPRGARLDKIAAFLEVRPSDLVAPVGSPLPVAPGREPNAPNAQQVRDRIHQPEEILLIEIWGELSTEIRSALMTLILAAADRGRKPPEAA